VYLRDFVALLSVGGIVAGVGQCFALRQHIVLNLWNVLLWLIGNVLSTLVPLGLVIDTTNPITVMTASAWIGGLLGFVVGAVQCIVLLGAMRWTGTWILASVFAGAVGWPLGSFIQNLVAGHIDLGGYVVNLMLSGTLLALLLSQRNRKGTHRADRTECDEIAQTPRQTRRRFRRCMQRASFLSLHIAASCADQNWRLHQDGIRRL